MSSVSDGGPYIDFYCLLKTSVSDGGLYSDWSVN